MKRWLPSPLLSVGLFALWLVLNQSLSIDHLLLAGVLGLLVPRITAPLRPIHSRIRRPTVLAHLILAVGMDVITSSVQVAWGVLRSHWRGPNGAFVRIPLELRDPSALAALAVITTVVPGTVWSELALDHSVLLVHVFDLKDEAAFVAHYKARYERSLQEIFE
ncbi:MAG: Na+/H+ antiporter subunit E [Betaproteobacteria bacterium]